MNLAVKGVRDMFGYLLVALTDWALLRMNPPRDRESGEVLDFGQEFEEYKEELNKAFNNLTGQFLFDDLTESDSTELVDLNKEKLEKYLKSKGKHDS